ncbi:hypothetical protein [Gymnodinialimonas sp. 57CJ19]|uniref:hypothetical protein n=1 Tax=Gymnodinialimonas sp. 57CJ19 TaxID=3138498 RepID=UPI0031344371
MTSARLNIGSCLGAVTNGAVPLAVQKALGAVSIALRGRPPTAALTPNASGGFPAIGQTQSAKTVPLYSRTSPFLNGITIAAAVALWGDHAGLTDLN